MHFMFEKISHIDEDGGPVVLKLGRITHIADIIEPSFIYVHENKLFLYSHIIEINVIESTMQ